MKRDLLSRRIRSFIFLLLLLSLFPSFKDGSGSQTPSYEGLIYIQVVRDGVSEGVIPFASEKEARSFLAGLGVTPEGDLGGGMKVVVSNGISTIHPMDGKESILFGVPVDINLADTEDLTALPGIGEGLARRIVERRAKKGPFCSVYDLKGVKGIGEKKLKKLKGLVTVKEWACRRP